MRCSKQMLSLALGAAVTLGPALALGGEGAQATPTQASGEGKTAPAAAAKSRCTLHGGHVTSTPTRRFETVFTPLAIYIYVYTAKDAPQQVGDVRGIATAHFRKGPPKVLQLAPDWPGEGEKAIYYCSMHPEVTQEKPGTCAQCGMALTQQNRIMARADFSKVPADTMIFNFKINNLAGEPDMVMYEETYVPPAHSTGAKSPAEKPGDTKPGTIPTHRVHPAKGAKQ